MSSAPVPPLPCWRPVCFFWAGVLACAFLFIWLFKGILLPFVAGFVVAYLLDPLVVRLAHRGLSRGAASLLILLTFLVFVLGSLMLTLPVLLREMTSLAFGLPGLIEQLRQQTTELFQAGTAPFGLPLQLPDLSGLLHQSLGQALSISTGIFTGLLNGGGTAASLLSFIALMPVIAFFALKEWPNVLARADDLLPRESAPTFRDLLRKIDQRLGAFVRGQVTVCFILAAYYAVALSLAGLDYGVLIGLFSGLLSFIPFVGTGLGLIGALVVALIQSGWGEWTLPLTVLAIFALGQFAEGNFITPKLVGDAVGLHPLWILFALMAGGSLLGLLGVMIAVPVAAVLAVILDFAATQYRASSYYTGPQKPPVSIPQKEPASHDPSAPPAAP